MPRTPISLAKGLAAAAAILALAPIADAKPAARPTAAAAKTPARTTKWTIIEQSEPVTSPLLVAIKKGEAAGPKAPVAPILGLTCDHQGFYVAVRWSDSSVRTFARNGHVPVSWTIDGGKPSDPESWSVNGGSVFLRGALGQTWFKTLVPAKRLVVFIGTKNDRAQATFDLTGIDKVDSKLAAIPCGKADAKL